MAVAASAQVSGRNRWLWLGGLIVALGAALGYWAGQPRPRDLPPKSEVILETGGGGSEREGIATPALKGFKGDLALGGTPGAEGKVNPFVIGDIITLNVESNQIEAFRWTCQGEVLEWKGQVWSAEPAREFAIRKAGNYLFSVEGRAAGGAVKTLSKALGVCAAKIESVDSDLSPIDLHDRYLIGETFTLAVHMVEPLTEMEYQYRYLVNGQAVLDPTRKQEWTPNDWLTFHFDQAGEYRFKVQVRRSSAEQAEDEMALAKPIRAGTAIIDTFFVDTETTAAGSKVTLSAIPQWQGTQPPICRFGVMELKSPKQEYEWLPGADGKEWGADTRVWVPKRPGTYQVRAEISDGDGDPPDDFKIEQVIVTEGKEDF